MTQFKIKVNPRSSMRKVENLGNGKLKVFTTKPAVNNEANIDAMELLAEYFDVRKNNITIIKGKRSREKIVRVLKQGSGG